MEEEIKVLWKIIKRNIEHINTFEEAIDKEFHTEYEKYLLHCIAYATVRGKEIELLWDSIAVNEIVQFSHVVLNINSLTGIYLTTLSLHGLD